MVWRLCAQYVQVRNEVEYELFSLRVGVEGEFFVAEDESVDRMITVCVWIICATSLYTH